MPLADETISAQHGKETDIGIADKYVDLIHLRFCKLSKLTSSSQGISERTSTKSSKCTYIGHPSNMPSEATQKSLNSKQR